jgi:hypothetical protein
MKRIVLLAALAFACGGSENPPCAKIAGAWNLTDTLMSTSTSFCASSITSGNSKVVIAVTGPNSFTWTETPTGGSAIVINGQGNVDSCNVSIDLTASAVSQQTGYQRTIAATRALSITSTGSGVSQLTITTNPAQTGTPCTATFQTNMSR